MATYIAIVHDPSFTIPELRESFRTLRNCEDDEAAMRAADVSCDEGEYPVKLARVVWERES